MPKLASREGVESPTPMRRAGDRGLILLGQVWAWLFLVLLVAFFSITTPHFFDLFNFQSMGANAASM